MLGLPSERFYDSSGQTNVSPQRPELCLRRQLLVWASRISSSFAVASYFHVNARSRRRVLHCIKPLIIINLTGLCRMADSPPLQPFYSRQAIHSTSVRKMN